MSIGRHCHSIGKVSTETLEDSHLAAINQHLAREGVQRAKGQQDDGSKYQVCNLAMSMHEPSQLCNCNSCRYRRTKNRDNTAIQLQGGQFVQVQYFASVQPTNCAYPVHLAVVKAFCALGTHYISALTGSNAELMTGIGNVFHPVKLENRLIAVPITELQKKCVCISRSSSSVLYVCTIPNAQEKD